MPTLRHFDDEHCARFVTFGCYRKLPFLDDDAAKIIFLDELERIRTKHGIKILGYVVMPEHVHLVLYPPPGTRLGLVIRELKSRTAKRYFATMRSRRQEERRVFWQRRCYDQNCRTPEATLEQIRYCHHNPIRRGLVTEPGEWRWSSYSSCCGQTDAPLRVDPVGA